MQTPDLFSGAVDECREDKDCGNLEVVNGYVLLKRAPGQNLFRRRWSEGVEEVAVGVLKRRV